MLYQSNKTNRTFVNHFDTLHQKFVGWVGLTSFQEDSDAPRRVVCPRALDGENKVSHLER